MFSRKWNASFLGLLLVLPALAVHVPDASGQDASKLAGPASITTERANKFTATCSYRDLLVTTLIDRHGEDRDIAGEKLLEAFFTVMDARTACARGRESEALALYDSLLRISVPPRAIAAR
ncbi:MAG: hypothetical protein K2Z80_21190 [Xanthobacteraceae bacterium]|nr:hypothetical protein [Xanthobacteraceae bacterium]